MKLNKYLFNTINNKERGHGHRSVVWLKHDQSALLASPPCVQYSIFLVAILFWAVFICSFSILRNSQL